MWELLNFWLTACEIDEIFSVAGWIYKEEPAMLCINPLLISASAFIATDTCSP